MIKKLFVLQSIFFYVVATSQVLTYVGSSALVTIQPQTLVYNGGGLQTAGTSVINNSGHIMVRGVSANLSTDDVLNIESTSNFNLKLASISNYGQLYVTGIPQGKISGKVNKEYLADYRNGDTGSQQIGLPFYNFTTANLASVFPDINITNTANNSSGRFNPSSAFWWNNARARFDQIANTGTAYTGGVPNASFISPMTYYILPRRKSDGTYFWQFPTTDKKIFSGIPASDVIGNGINNVSFALSGGYSGSFGNTGNSANTFGEQYYTYLNDPFRTKTPTWAATGYGLNLYQMANPFLTNIDLKYIARTGEVGSDDNYIPTLEGIAYYADSNVNWSTDNGTVYNGTTVILNTSGGRFQAGDVNNTIIKPMGAFMVKLSTNAAQTLNFTKTRRFKQTSRADGTDYSVTSAKTTTEEDDDVPADKVVKQVAVVMYDLDGFELDRTYYAVSPSAVTGYNSANALLQAYGTDKKIYTKEEKSTGGEDAGYADKLYINEANEITFKTKEIPLYVNYTVQPYQLKFEVYERGERVESGLSDGTSFYIKDAQNQIVKIVDGQSLSMNGTQTLGLYYEKPSNVTLGTDFINYSQTIIAKKDGQWVVRFAKDWKNASVEVYSAAGQLLNAKSKISTNSDYIVPINTQVKSTFVVKATSETGEVVIKKILN